MKALKMIFSTIGALTLLLGVLVLAARLLAPQGSGAAGIEQVSVISADALQDVIESSKRIGGILTWVFIVTAVVMQIAAWIAAASKLGKVKAGRASNREKLDHLENIEIYFDLPLYLGLLGTVFSFILISIYPDTGLMFAYASTAIGIVVSVILRLGYLTPYKQTLIANLYQPTPSEPVNQDA